MIEKAGKIGLVIAAIALAFALGLWTRPALHPPERAALKLDGASTPTQIGISRVSVPKRMGEVGVEAEPQAAREDVVQQVALGRELKDQYPEEARDEAWAPRVEAFYAGEIARFLSLVVPEATDIQIECKTATCKLTFVVPAEHAEVAFGREQAMPLGDVWQPFDELLDDGRVRVGMYVGIGTDRRPFDALTARYHHDYQGRFAVPEDQLVMYFERDEARVREEMARLHEEKNR